MWRVVLVEHNQGLKPEAILFTLSMQSSEFTLLLRVSIFDMTFQITPPRKRNFTNFAPIGRVICVYVHVELQIGQLIERLLAQCTLVRFFTCVNEDMISQVALLVETFSAAIANKFFFETVSAHMGFQGGRSVERFLANVALVRFFLSVNYFMPTQRRRQTKTFPACTAHKRPCNCVIWHF